MFWAGTSDAQRMRLEEPLAVALPSVTIATLGTTAAPLVMFALTLLLGGDTMGPVYRRSARHRSRDPLFEVVSWPARSDDPLVYYM